MGLQTSELWTEVYNFSEGGASLANWMDTYVDGKFAHQVDPKDGYSIRDCRSVRHCRLLEYIVPIIHLDKPTRVTITIGNTILGALDSGRLVEWGVVFRDLAQRLAAGVGKPKPTPIFPFLFHLYDSQGLLTKEEETNYKTAEKLVGYWITPEPESRSESKYKGRANTLVASPVREEPLLILNRLQRMKKMYRAPQGSPPVRSRGEGSR